MPSDRHESPPDGPAVDDPDEGDSIDDSSLLSPPTSHRHPQLHTADPRGLHSFVEVAHDQSVALSTTAIFEPTAAPSGPVRASTHPEYSEDVLLPNLHPLSPHSSLLRGHAHSPPPPPHIVPAPQPVISLGGYAPAESLPPQNYISRGRTMPRLNIPFYPPTSHGTSLLTPSATPHTHGVSTPTAVVPLNSELARPPRFTFAPPGANVPADPVVSAAGPSPTSGRRRDKDKSKGKIDKASQVVAEASGGRTRSNSWSVVSSVFRRKSGRRSGPPQLATDKPRLANSDWRDLAQWAPHPGDDSWGEGFGEQPSPYRLS
ncbi:hypothetical protein EI94DRAFT_201248 [Lactarius quietus]|nr:hypothetical protein EI94DRAFT_201248 [Lactarius quietus]